MKWAKFLLYAVMAVYLVNIAMAATIHGTVYDLSLKKINNAKVEIDTAPRQVLIAQNGIYSFNVPNGKYSITAQLAQKSTVAASVQENITISQQGDYVLDLILFPDLEDESEEIDIVIDGELINVNSKDQILIAVFIVLFVSGISAGILYFLITRKKKPRNSLKEESVEGDLEQIIDIIKEEGGRTTQKEIRKQIPLSEAKISLMIAELEHKGVVQKIKKGRGNIIILKKK